MQVPYEDGRDYEVLTSSRWNLVNLVLFTTS